MHMAKFIKRAGLKVFLVLSVMYIAALFSACHPKPGPGDADHNSIQVPVVK